MKLRARGVEYERGLVEFVERVYKESQWDNAG